ncbi:putative S-adenosyl-L-methionine-dependent methyltransferase [Mycolicibacterium chitae]|uniref:S-adenosyl-L-methionine-dependent methyltransferase n=1 Tax=Mycolicibacterium chitae TaxID=1792 RepID=A0A3S4RUY3_MYCCI|nr:class I SAM-dependent methyltransferase [Mycolicibacterium chitae]MCV7108411.1 class I SAM-dependent methyltransferase [Mycolicibacterium chitae]BBZ00642.1 putative S-adenosyl-L-methionine-dependent methyltransferase [Mycolicibacterium chitae]VEG49490.1 methyltransferase, putative, TIGR00027 family [Mycolicibacterium chitae]
MARTDDDTWDLASSVGATATMVAAARAMATRAEPAVIDDPYAAPLVEAVGIEFFARLARGELTAAELDGGDSPVGMSRFADGMAARTRFFDDFFAAAAEAGIRQAVILASGLDARGYRLAWPTGTVLYEIDQPEVIEFKTTTLAGLGAQPRVDLRTVAIDLRADWPAALTAAGFDPAAPTAWIAEGLFGYLPPEGQDRLLDQISALSAPGSRLAAEGVPSQADADEDETRERMQASADRWREHGFDIDFSALVFLGDRADVTSYLQAHGWSTTAATANDLLVRYGMQRLDADEGFAAVTYVSAEK